MAQAQYQNVCRDCVQILQHAAALLVSPPSSRKSSRTEFDTGYQSRLTANATSSSCHLCSLLYAHVPRISTPLCSEESLALEVSEARYDARASTLGLVGFDKERPDRRTYYLGELRIQPAAYGDVRTLESDSTWTLETLDCLRDWLLSCVSASSHRDCNNLRSVGRLPLRLIDVRSTGLGHQPMSAIGLDEFNRLSLENCHDVRIVSAAQSLSLDTMYLTLSHRWGSPPGILLTAKTSFLLTDDIAPYLLETEDAAVFRHAIHVTRALGFRYIWIDALCIMQDDEQERTAEIMEMDEIYFNSMLNISAAEGQSSKGLVFARELLRTNPCRSTVQAPESLKCQLWARERVSDLARIRKTYCKSNHGVAKRFCHAMSLDPSSYVAGMWKEDLPLSMIWRQEPLPGRIGPEPTSIGREMKYAPSWSWTSVLAPTAGLDPNAPFVATIEVLGLELTRRSANFFDGTESCRLCLRGPLTKIWRHVRDGEVWVRIGQYTEFREFDEFDFQKGNNIEIMWDTAREIGSNEFFLLHIATEHSVDGRIERGVVACRAAADRGTFYRAGSFMIPFGIEYSALDVERAFQGCSHLLGEDDFLERRLSGKCVIGMI